MVVVFRTVILAEVKRIYLNCLALVACSFLTGAASLHGADRLLWQSDAISADISGWDLPKLLQKLSTDDKFRASYMAN